MGLEAAPTFISDLNAAWPLGTDVKSAGDDHLRNIKATLLATFPSITGAVTATHAELNQLAGAAAGAGMVSDIAALTDPNADRLLFWDDSAGAVAQLAPDGTSIAISGTTLSTGSNVPLKDANNTFTAGTQTINPATGSAILNITSTANSTQLQGFAISGLTGLWAISNTALSLGTNSTSRFEISGAGNFDFKSGTLTVGGNVVTAGTLTIAGTGETLATFADDGACTLYYDNSAKLATASGGVSVTGALTASAGFVATTGGLTVSAGGVDVTGNVTTPHSSAQEVGYQGAPSVSISTSGSTAANYAGCTVRLAGGSGQTFTLDGDPPTDSVVVLDNASGNAWTIAASSSLVWAATGGTGSRTLANGGLAVALHQGSGVWKISGGGLS